MNLETKGTNEIKKIYGIYAKEQPCSKKLECTKMCVPKLNCSKDIPHHVSPNTAEEPL
jgi:hypothetical protein